VRLSRRKKKRMKRMKRYRLQWGPWRLAGVPVEVIMLPEPKGGGA